MHMNAYVERVIESVRQKHGNEPEFVHFKRFYVMLSELWHDS